MIYSMTGYGKAVKEMPGRKITVEIKSLNSKQLDLSMRVPSFFREKELEVRTYLAQRIGRGKVDFSMYCENHQTDRLAHIDEALFAQYYASLKSLRERNQMDDPSDLMRLVMGMPDVVKQELPEIGDEEFKQIFECIEEATNNFIAFREQEGRSLERDLREKIALIDAYSQEVPRYERERIEKIKARIIANIEEVVERDKIDHNRLEQELIYYVEKLDINEEKVRLANHLSYFLETIETDPQAGKKLGFIAQEIGREVNTMGSKANQAEMQRLVVQMKDELEKIKEQVLNVL